MLYVPLLIHPLIFQIQRDVAIVENEVIEKDSPRDLPDSTSKDDRDPSPLRRIQELCRTYDLSVPSDVRLVQHLMKDALEAFASAGADEECRADLK